VLLVVVVLFMLAVAMMGFVKTGIRVHFDRRYACVAWRGVAGRA
jgi:hypothetical protein